MKFTTQALLMLSLLSGNAMGYTLYESGKYCQNYKTLAHSTHDTVGECEALTESDPDCGDLFFFSAHYSLVKGSFHCYCNRKENAQCTTGNHPQFNVYKTGGAAKPSASGDPHFETWSGQKYDFHGGCDLVLVENEGFENGLGLTVHVRTTIKTWWSHISTAAVRVGDHTFEITGGDKKIAYYVDGEKVEDMQSGDAALGDYPLHFRRVNGHQSQTRVGLGGKDAISIETFKEFVRVNVKVDDPAKFAGSLGMLGSYPTGNMVARDGVTIIEEANGMGQEWMVRPTDPRLFSEGSFEYPLTCTMPESSEEKEHRRLGEASITKEDAELACARVEEKDRDACIFDVLATQDKSLAGSY